jgi:hypothetical protein
MRWSARQHRRQSERRLAQRLGKLPEAQQSVQLAAEWLD